MINKYVIGSGVVCGLQIIAVDDKTIYIQPGIAIDNLGREIVVASPITQKLSLIDGFSTASHNKDIYLCMAYDEKGKEPVYSLSNENDNESNVGGEYNRVVENYRIYIKEEEHNTYKNNLDELMEQLTVMYDDSKIRVYQVMPKYVVKGSSFDIKVVIEKLVQLPNVSVNYELVMENLEVEDGEIAEDNRLVINFEEGQQPMSPTYELKYTVRASDESDTVANISVNNKNILLKIGDKKSSSNSEVMSKIKIINSSIKKEIEKTYFADSLEERTRSNSESCIHLAKISILQAGPAFMIEKIVENPLHEYVYSNFLLKKLATTVENLKQKKLKANVLSEMATYGENPSLDVDYNEEENELKFSFKYPERSSLTDNYSTGVMEILLENKLLQNKCFYSDDIEHGLGKGVVSIVLGIEQDEDSPYAHIDAYSEGVFYGDYKVFEDSPYEGFKPNVSLGAVVYPKKGVFRIGVKCLSSIIKQTKLG